jgi:hypothetical protein
MSPAASSAVTRRRLRADRLGKPAATGPTSATGKARSAQNARRHGLNVPVMYDPDAGGIIEAIAAEIVPGCQDFELLGRARRIAEAQFDLMRVVRARLDMLSWAMADPDYRVPGGEPEEGAQRPGSTEKLVSILADLGARLVRLDRYERDAMTRRKRAVRAYDAACRKARRRLRPKVV